MARGRMVDWTNAKFKVGDTTYPNNRCPAFLGIKKRKRTVARIYYDPKKQCSYYMLGSNHKGDIAEYPFRSYMLAKTPIGHRPKKVLDNA